MTYTLKYSSCNWITILALDTHYHKTLVDAEFDGVGYKLKTENVRALDVQCAKELRREAPIDIDGQKLKAPLVQGIPSSLFLVRRDGKWIVPSDHQSEEWHAMRQKRPQLQGPIDDAFTTDFLCVRGTGQPWNAAAQRYADACLRRLEAEWGKFFRGELPVKNDTEVTGDDWSSKTLVLFGDPGSNMFLRRYLKELPLEWTKDKISFAGNTVEAGSHVPIMIYPRPDQRNRYIVLNSGHTFHASDFQGTNALLYPRLGDYALLKLTGNEKDPLAMEVVTAGLFDEFWRLPK